MPLREVGRAERGEEKGNTVWERVAGGGELRVLLEREGWCYMGGEGGRLENQPKKVKDRRLVFFCLHLPGFVRRGFYYLLFYFVLIIFLYLAFAVLDIKKKAVLVFFT